MSEKQFPKDFFGVVQQQPISTKVVGTWVAVAQRLRILRVPWRQKNAKVWEVNLLAL